MHNRIPTNHTVSCMCLSQNGCKSKVSNLDLPLIAIHKNVVTLKVPVYDRWIMTMQVKKPTQYLA